MHLISSHRTYYVLQIDIWANLTLDPHPIVQIILEQYIRLVFCYSLSLPFTDSITSPRYSANLFLTDIYLQQQVTLISYQTGIMFSGVEVLK